MQKCNENAANRYSYVGEVYSFGERAKKKEMQMLRMSTAPMMMAFLRRLRSKPFRLFIIAINSNSSIFFGQGPKFFIILYHISGFGARDTIGDFRRIQPVIFGENVGR